MASQGFVDMVEGLDQPATVRNNSAILLDKAKFAHADQLRFLCPELPGQEPHLGALVPIFVVQLQFKMDD